MRYAFGRGWQEEDLWLAAEREALMSDGHPHLVRPVLEPAPLYRVRCARCGATHDVMRTDERFWHDCDTGEFGLLPRPIVVRPSRWQRVKRRLFRA